MRCVRTVRLGLPNTALLPYKTRSTLQRIFADYGMGLPLGGDRCYGGQYSPQVFPGDQLMTARKPQGHELRLGGDGCEE